MKNFILLMMLFMLNLFCSSYASSEFLAYDDARFRMIQDQQLQMQRQQLQMQQQQMQQQQQWMMQQQRQQQEMQRQQQQQMFRNMSQQQILPYYEP